MKGRRSTEASISWQGGVIYVQRLTLLTLEP